MVDGGIGVLIVVALQIYKRSWGSDMLNRNPEILQIYVQGSGDGV
jgi:hypothetical protein